MIVLAYYTIPDASRDMMHNMTRPMNARVSSFLTVEPALAKVGVFAGVPVNVDVAKSTVAAVEDVLIIWEVVVDDEVEVDDNGRRMVNTSEPLELPSAPAEPDVNIT